MSPDETTVAIACQGGGSHTAFTAGVLSELLENLPENHRIVGFSGTSGGAACATLAWYGQVHPEENPRDLLERFWDDLSASTPLHRAANNVIRWTIGLQRAGVPLPEVSPANSPGSRWGLKQFREVLESHVDFEAVPSLLEGDEPGLFISAIDVCAGRFEVFREDDLSAGAILASAAEPHLFEAVEVDGTHYWDGLFAKNPPINDFMSADDVPDPDEIWLLKINPQERPGPPQSMEGIDNRRNELSGNLSLNVEINFLEKVNGWIEAGYLPEEYTHTTVERIPFPGGDDLDWRTKLDRDPAFIDRLFSDGEREARAFLERKA
ncbi:patatin-like phospholipase family protein [Natronobiforma cellulositropha]|uniref:patatin-like phospholipase family protein n=1 Tax=Natronobiforma cellulositropha TaxID=1679076 RepID=UPI0021D58AA4|nr:patatin-like phospholipase family protein [Natronobiforma cellulositropha]